MKNNDPANSNIQNDIILTSQLKKNTLIFHLKLVQCRHLATLLLLSLRFSPECLRQLSLLFSPISELG